MIAALPAPFLAAGASAEAAALEQALLSQLAAAETADTFVVADRLGELYFKNLRRGGREGREWLTDVRQEAARRIDEEDSYAHFLRFQGQEASLILPAGVSPPLGLRFSEEWGRPEAIPLETRQTVFLQKTFYFHLEDLLFPEALVPTQDMKEARPRIAARDLRVAATVVRHLRTGRHLVQSGAAVCLQLREAGFAYVLGRLLHQDIFVPPNFALKDLQVGDRPEPHRPVLAAIPPAPFTLGFEPRRTPTFAPRVVTLIRHGRPYPLLIEEQDVEGLLRLAPPDRRQEILLFRSQERGRRSLILSFRAMDGTLDGYCLNGIDGSGMMVCDRSYKIDRDKKTEILHFGLAVTMARLQFLKENGFWRESGLALTLYIPQVIGHYRALVGLPQSSLASLGHSLDSVTFPEALKFLERNPLHFKKLA